MLTKACPSKKFFIETEQSKCCVLQSNINTKAQKSNPRKKKINTMG